MQIIPIASGKGGVGKTLVAANLAIALAQSGRRVILIDLDLGGSNLHLVLGVHVVAQSIGSFLGRKGQDFAELIQESGTPHLGFIPGDAEIPGLANLNSSQKRMLIRRIHALDADYVVLDLGAGTSQNILDFFLVSSSGLIVTAPTPTATVNAYLFLKNVVFRILQSSVVAKSPGEKFVRDLFKHRSSLQRIYMPEIAREIDKVDPESASRFRAAVQRFRPRVIMNMLEDPKDAETINRLRRSCRQYLDTELVHLGIIYRDELQDRALQSRLPILRYKPDSILSQAIYRIADKVIQMEDEEQGALLDFESLNDSFEAAESEAEQDFTDKMEYVEELLSTGALTNGDLIETIKTQHYEISQLRRQNNLYKAKLVQAMQQGFRP